MTRRLVTDPWKRVLLVSWIIMLALTWVLALLPRPLPVFSPERAWVLLTVCIAAFVSFVVSVLMQRGK